MEIELKPLETKTIDIIATASHSPWPGADKTDSFKIEVSSDQQGTSPTELIYYLNISKAYWINLKKNDIIPESQFVVTQSTTTINATWWLEASEAAFNDLLNEQYNTKIELIKDNIVIETKTERYEITNNWAIEQFITQLEIPNSEGEYIVNLTIDSDNEIKENISNGAKKEDDNSIYITLTTKDPDENVTWCGVKFNKNANEINCSIGESNCWIAQATPNPSEYKSCCGDDNNPKNECWLDDINNSCCYSNSKMSIAYIDDPDDSTTYCGLLSELENANSLAICDELDDGKRYCWHDKYDCCGNDDEHWSYYTNNSITDIVILNGTCYKNKWAKQKKGMYYPINFDIR